jgi:hypothetical protein
VLTGFFERRQQQREQREREREREQKNEQEQGRAREKGNGNGHGRNDNSGRGCGAVVLLDEIEKAHPHVLDIFLPCFDEGYLVDGRWAINRRRY